MISAVVFDFDGLIIDTETTLLQSWRELYHEHDLELGLESYTAVVGSADHFDAVAELERRLGRSLDQEAIRRRVRARYLELVELEPIRPGVRERVQEARALGLKLGIASSSSREWVQGHLGRRGLDGWQCLRCRGEAPKAKPHPDLYLAVIECLGVQPAAALAIEDSANGVLAAKRAGLWCLAVPNVTTAGLDLSLADEMASSLADVTLEDVIGRLSAPRPA